MSGKNLDRGQMRNKRLEPSHLEISENSSGQAATRTVTVTRHTE